MNESTFDTNRVRYAPTPTANDAPRVQRPSHTSAGRFLRGPVPLSWLMAAARLRTRGLHLAVALAFLAGVKKRHKNIKLSYALLKEFGLDRHAAYRALNDLVASGLVEVVERRPGRSPVVSMRLASPAGERQEGPL